MNHYDYVYTKLRKQLGAQCGFSATTCVTVRNREALREVVPRWEPVNPSFLIMETGPEMSSHAVNTLKFRTSSRGQTHKEGGWPKDVDPGEPQETTKWRKRLEKDPQFTSSALHVCRNMKQLVEQNLCCDLFEEFFAGESPDLELHTFESNTVGIFRIKSTRGGVSKLNWHPDGGSRFIACYGDFHSREDHGVASPSLVWDVNNSNTAIIELTSAWNIVTAQFYSRNPDLIAAGNVVGRVEFFDLRTGSGSVATSKYESSHHDPVYDLTWLQSKTHSEFVSASTDGQVIWWDTRNLSQPTETCILPNKLGGTCLEWQQDAGPTKYLIGTEEGTSLSLTRKPKKPVEVGGWYGVEDHGGSLQHHGPVYSIKRNPFHPKYFITVGDWTAKLWTEELKSPLVQTAPTPAQLSCGAWSPSRPGLFITARIDGVLDFYDYHYQMNQIAYSHKLGDIPIRACSPSGTGRLVAAGDSSGVVSLVRLCEELSVPSSNAEKTNVGTLLEREQRRERNLEAVRKMPKIVRSPAELGIADQYKSQHTIDQESYLARERAWLTANITESSPGKELTVKLGVA
jgi:dynein intermediate chain 2